MTVPPIAARAASCARRLAPSGGRRVSPASRPVAEVRASPYQWTVAGQRRQQKQLQRKKGTYGRWQKMSPQARSSPPGPSLQQPLVPCAHLFWSSSRGAPTMRQSRQATACSGASLPGGPRATPSFYTATGCR